MLWYLPIAAAALSLVASVGAHFTFVHRPSQIACDWNASEGINWLSQPITEGAPFDEWWFHGQVQCQDKATGVFELPANGTITIVMSSRVKYAPAPYGRGAFMPPDPDYVFSDEEWAEPLPDKPATKGNHLGGRHNIHAHSRNDTSGCALAIAYKSEATDVRPEDFVIFTVVHDCPKRQRESNVEVPNLPACPDGNCICAWFWNPKNSGLKNFYMTPFVCSVTGADPNASPVDVAHAIPPRRCLDPENCNFGPRQPMYYLGTGDEINMAEPINQSPHYSIMYGFREGAQHDIFEHNNPRRHLETLVKDEPPRCDGEPSRLSDSDAEAESWRLKSSNCKCTAELESGVIEIRMESEDYKVARSEMLRNEHTRQIEQLSSSTKNGSQERAFTLKECQGHCDEDRDCQDDLICHHRERGAPVPGCRGGEQSESDFCVRPFVNLLIQRTKQLWRYNIAGTKFGPMDVVRSAEYKAGPEYFPLSYGPYRMDLNDECYLHVTSNDGVVVWESPVNDPLRRMVIGSFTGRDPDPKVWPVVADYSLSANHRDKSTEHLGNGSTQINSNDDHKALHLSDVTAMPTHMSIIGPTFNGANPPAVSPTVAPADLKTAASRGTMLRGRTV
ncbi:hypothetical protein ACHAWF_010088 [Thalassiosira exigua]